MKFPYTRSVKRKSHTSELIEIYEPYVPVLVYTPRAQIRLDVLVDTGSNQTILPNFDADMAYSETANVKGLGGYMETVRLGKDVYLEITTNGKVYKWPAAVWFNEAMGHPPIAGHFGFLEFFTATFDGKAHELSLQPNDLFPGKIQNLWETEEKDY